MILKRYTEFLNDNRILEFYNEDEVLERSEKAETILESMECEKVNGRWNCQNFNLNALKYESRKYFVYRGILTVKFGRIKDSFILSGADLKNMSIENLPTYVGVDLDLSNNHISTLEDFNTQVTGSLNLSHNHLHKLENMPTTLEGEFNVNANMLTTLEGCPEEVQFFYGEDNFVNTAFGAPKRVLGYNNNAWHGKLHGAGGKLDDKIPLIEREFYAKRAYYNPKNNDNGIVNYWVELFQFIMEKYKDNKEEMEKQITYIKWPNDVKGDLLKKSVQAVSKFSL